MFNQSLVPQKKQREHAQKGVKEKEKIYLKNIPANVNVEYMLFWMDTKERTSVALTTEPDDQNRRVMRARAIAIQRGHSSSHPAAHLIQGT